VIPVEAQQASSNIATAPNRKQNFCNGTQGVGQQATWSICRCFSMPTVTMPNLYVFDEELDIKHSLKMLLAEYLLFPVPLFLRYHSTA